MGRWKVQNVDMIALHKEAKSVAASFEEFKIEHMLRVRQNLRVVFQSIRRQPLRAQYYEKSFQPFCDDQLVEFVRVPVDAMKGATGESPLSLVFASCRKSWPLR